MDMSFTEGRAPLVKLLDLYDRKRITLPDDVLAARAAVDAVEQYAATVPPADVDGGRADLARAVVAAARAGTRAPSPGAVVKTIDAARAAEELRTAITAATLELVNALAATLSGNGDCIIVEHLRPQHDRAVTDAREAARAIAAHGTNPVAVLRAPTPAITAELVGPRTKLSEAVDAYDAAHAARSAIATAAGGVRADARGEYAWCRNLADLWPARNAPAATPPWPEDPLEAFMWRITSGADLWLPTPGEQADAYAEAPAHAMAHQRNARHAGQGVGVYVRAS